MENHIDKNDAFMNSLFNIVNDETLFKEELSRKVETLKDGDRIKILVGNNLKVLEKKTGKLIMSEVSQNNA